MKITKQNQDNVFRNTFLMIAFFGLVVYCLIFIGLSNRSDNRIKEIFDDLETSNNAVISVPEPIENPPQIESEELHWNHLPIKYKIDEYCINRQYDGEIESAIDYISNETVITFERVYSDEDILYTCDPKLLQNSSHDTIAEAESFFYGNEYSYGTVYFYRKYSCSNIKPTIWIHETLHLVGLNDKHSSTTYDVMNEYESSREYCDNVRIIEEDKNYLNNIYG